MLRIALSFLLCLLLASPALAQINGSRPSGFFPETGGTGDSTASYFVLGASPNLTNERLLTFSDNFTTVDNGPGNTYTVDLANVGIIDGGTGATTQQGAVNNILNFSGKASGDTIYYNGTNWVRLPKGSDTQVLTLVSGLPAWSSGSAGAPASAPYIVQALDATLSAERVATGTANRIVITDGGANGNMTWDIGTDVVTLTGTQTLTNKTLTQPLFTYHATQAMGLRNSTATFTGSLIWADFTGNRTLTIPDPGASASFVMTAGAQTIAGVKTFSASPVLSTNTITGSGANTVTLFTSSDTVVGRATTDTLTNKTLTAPIFTSNSFTLQQSTANYTFQWNNPAAARTYTVRDVATNAHFAMTDTAATYTAGGAAYAINGTINFTAAGTSGQPLLSGGTGAPSYNTLGATAGGTGQTTWTTGDIPYASATNTISKRAIGTTNQVLAVSGGLPTWQSLSTLGVPTTSPNTVGGRLSVSSTNPCGEGSNTSLFYVPYTGQTIALYNGTAWVNCTFSTITRSLSGLTANTNYDAFVYDANADGVADTIDLVAWSSDTLRATALATQDSIYVKSAATGRRYVGTIRTTGTTGQTADTSGSGSAAGSRFVCNYYNQVLRTNCYRVGTNTWSYASTTVRPWNNTMAAMAYVKCTTSADAPVIGTSTVYSSGANKHYNTFAATVTPLYGVTGSMHSGSGAGDYGSETSQIILTQFDWSGYFTITPSEVTNGSTMSVYENTTDTNSPSAGVYFETYQ